MNFQLFPGISSASPPVFPPKSSPVGVSLGDYLSGHESEILRIIISELSSIRSERDRTLCDRTFGHYTHGLLYPYAEIGLATRAANFARDKLVPQVLKFEATHPVKFHKGALFYDTGLAHLVSGDEGRFEYFLAMVDEEEFETHGVEGKPQRRGDTNMRTSDLSKATVESRIRFAVDSLNGSVASHPATYGFVFGAPITYGQMDGWRRSLLALHHFELFRLLHDAQIFSGASMPSYSSVTLNPYIMLRLAKALAHVCQWVESYLTVLQSGSVVAESLSGKLKDDPHFASLITPAGGKKQFAGSPPHGADVDRELRGLLSDLSIAVAPEQKYWRILRILYITRNSTAHHIDPSLGVYSDRSLMLALFQVVFLSAFVIVLLKTGSLPL